MVNVEYEAKAQQMGERDQQCKMLGLVLTPVPFQFECSHHAQFKQTEIAEMFSHGCHVEGVHWPRL